MARFLARRQTEIHPRAPDPQVLGIDLVSLLLTNPLIPSPTTTTTNNIPVTTTLVTNPPVITTTVITTGNDGQPTTVTRTDTQTNMLPTTMNGNGPNAATTSRTAPNHTTASPGPNGNGDTSGTSTAQDPSAVSVGGGTSTKLSDPASGASPKVWPQSGQSFSTLKGCASSCDWQFGTTGTRTGSAGVSPTGGTGDGADHGGGNSNLGALIGGVVSAIIGAALLVLAIYFLVRRARSHQAADNADDAAGLLRDTVPFRSGPASNRQSRMTIETRHRPPSFGTLYGLRYDPDAAGGADLIIGDPSHSAPPTPPDWKTFTPGPPPRIGSKSAIRPNDHSSSRSENDTTDVRRHSVDNRDRPNAEGTSTSSRLSRVPFASLRTTSSAENPFDKQTDPPDHGNGTGPSMRRGNLDVTRTISQSSGSLRRSCV